MPKKFKKLTLQYAYLQIELEEVTDACINIEGEIREYMEENYPEQCKEFYTPVEVQPITEKVDISDNIEDDIITDDESEESEVLEESPDVSDEDEMQTTPKTKNKDLKKLYRKIAEKTHPDKVGNDQHAHLFSLAAKAYSENDIGTLLSLAGILNIELLELSEVSIALLEKNINGMIMNIDKRKKTTAWVWTQCKSDEEKSQIIQQILSTKGIHI